MYNEHHNIVQYNILLDPIVQRFPNFFRSRLPKNKNKFPCLPLPNIKKKDDQLQMVKIVPWSGKVIITILDLKEKIKNIVLETRF